MSQNTEINVPENKNKTYRINEGASTSKSSENTNRCKKQHYENWENINTEVKQYGSNLLPDPSTSITTIVLLETDLISIKGLEAAKDSADRLRIRNILYQIYNHTLHDEWFEAKDLMLRSCLQETIQHSDRSLQILYNLTMAHLGLCAFRHAKVKEAHSCLTNLIRSRKLKELLGQGFLPQEREEEGEYEVPFHMLVNLELLECVYLVVSMLIDIPYLVAHESDIKSRRISHLFYQQLCSSERQNLVGPPESMREHLAAAAKALRNGNWSACNNFIINEKMNVKVWNLFYQADKIRAMLTKLIKEESLRTYLFTYSHVYDTISIEMLAEMFELEKVVVHSTISKMIVNEELMALLDGPTQTLVMQKNKLLPLQSLAVQLIDKINNFMDLNEKILKKHKSQFHLERSERGQFQKRKAKASRTH